VGALGVRRPWRGRGLGRALLLRTFAEFRRRGVTRVTLGVDAENPTGATRLYESVGMDVELEAVVYEKTLA
jgi:ribosomal protein S18 acetylase RimI-like enzyme